MSYSENEKKIIGPFCSYASKTREGLYHMIWKNGTSVDIHLISIEDSDNNLELDDPNYEDFIEIVINVESLIAFNETDGLEKNWLQKGHLIGINYHNFPYEIYNSKGELISKREE